MNPFDPVSMAELGDHNYSRKRVCVEKVGSNDGGTTFTGSHLRDINNTVNINFGNDFNLIDNDFAAKVNNISKLILDHFRSRVDSHFSSNDFDFLKTSLMKFLPSPINGEPNDGSIIRSIQTDLQSNVMTTNSVVLPVISQIKTQLSHLSSDFKKIKHKISNPDYETDHNHKAHGTKTPNNKAHNYTFPPECLCIIDSIKFNDYKLLLNLIKENDQITNGEVIINHVNKHKNGRVYFHCNSVKCKELLIKIINDSNINVRARSIDKKHSYLSFGPVPLGTSMTDFVESIKKSDKRLSDIDILSNFRYHCSVKLSTGQIRLVYKVDHNFFAKLLADPFLNFNLRRIDIKRFKPLLQCHNCSRFGHTDKWCSNNPCCPNCAGKHSMRECSIPRNSPDQQYSFSNCLKAKLSHNHAAWQKCCTIRKNYITNLVNNIKND